MVRSAGSGKQFSGQVREFAAVVVNGVQLSTLWREPFLVRIDPFLHEGENQIEVQVTNLWPNRLIGDQQPSMTSHTTRTNVRAYRKDSPVFPSGLLLPVNLEIDLVQSCRR